MDSADDEENSTFSLLSLIPDKKCKPPEKCMSAELEKIIKKAILELPEQFRIAIVLRELQGLSYEEIAEATKSSVGTVKSAVLHVQRKASGSLRAYI